MSNTCKISYHMFYFIASKMPHFVILNHIKRRKYTLNPIKYKILKKIHLAPYSGVYLLQKPEHPFPTKYFRSPVLKIFSIIKKETGCHLKFVCVVKCLSY